MEDGHDVCVQEGQDRRWRCETSVQPSMRRTRPRIDGEDDDARMRLRHRAHELGDPSPLPVPEHHAFSPQREVAFRWPRVRAPADPQGAAVPACDGRDHLAFCTGAPAFAPARIDDAAGPGPKTTRDVDRIVRVDGRILVAPLLETTAIRRRADRWPGKMCIRASGRTAGSRPAPRAGSSPGETRPHDRARRDRARERLRAVGRRRA